ncbi:glutaredoxin domain-containing protein [Clostridium tetani]|uniref:glutaredoxin domain-containing protein n=1 Tax=Clostridium tetani TaxID=1513 RepID=UPI0002FDD935|nr:glutaredoxin domain-containing protein [Clostridium tetani]AVP55145.1 NrdH-redoxin [Clostridium tetani]KGI37169.1 glutaredoxin [Clostridium tetani]KGI40559.1 glutaredoxin [Clostridium tetani ATCC 9441]KGI42259.1 glutaredoxin [Clostridium tetani]KGI46152.1 glutaredoxin [Clostridium tetani]
MIKVYSTPTCPYCKKAKAYFDSKNVEYKDVNVAQDEKEKEEMIEKSGQQSVPVIDINGEIIVGFNKVAIDKALKEE